MKRYEVEPRVSVTTEGVEKSYFAMIGFSDDGQQYIYQGKLEAIEYKHGKWVKWESISELMRATERLLDTITVLIAHDRGDTPIIDILELGSLDIEFKKLMEG